MQRTDYGIVSHAEIAEPTAPATVSHSGLTDRLGCSETDVDAYRLDSDRITLSNRYESLCIPVGGDGTVTVERSTTVPSPGVAVVPADRECTLATTNAMTWLVISAPAGSSSDRQPTAVDAARCQFTTPETSNIRTARLTDQLGCTGMKVNLRRLDAGQAVPYHVEGRQEELFVPLTGAGTMRIADKTHHMPCGSVGRIAPETPRSVVNDGDDRVVWAMVGAPPTGASNEWDPGAVVVD